MSYCRGIIFKRVKCNNTIDGEQCTNTAIPGSSICKACSEAGAIEMTTTDIINILRGYSSNDEYTEV